MLSGISRYFNPLFVGLPIIIALIGLWGFGSELIESAYQGKSIAVINSLISSQKDHTLEEYLSLFRALLTLLTMASAIVIYFLLVWFSVEKRKQRVFNINAEQQLYIFSLAERYWLFFGLSLILGWIAYVLTILPGITYVNVMTHDTFVYFDGAYRLSQGQIPHLDFHTPLGALAYLLPYLGFSILDKFPGSMEFSNFIIALLVLAISIHVFSSRYRVMPSVIVLIYLFLLIIVPMDIGTQSFTHAMYYNRYGWVLLSLLFLFFIEPRKISQLQLIIDSICVGSLVVILFYIKITYFAFAIAMLPLMIFSSEFRRQVAIYSSALFGIVTVIVELIFPGLHHQYLCDILMAIEASGAVRNGLLSTFELNTNEFLLPIIALFLVLRVRRINIYDLGYAILVALSGVMLINQNAQSTGLVTIVALLLWSHEVSSRNDTLMKNLEKPSSQTLLVSTVILSLIILFVSQTIVRRTMGLGEFYSVVLTKKARYSTKIMADLFVGERQSYLAQVVNNNKNSEDIFNEMRVKRRKQNLTQGEYLETVEQGLLLIGNINRNRDSVMVFDLANPFSFLLSAKPPIGDYSWLHKGRNISKSNYVMPENLFKSIKYVMIPKFPTAVSTSQFLKQTYGDYINDRFEKVADNAFWEIHKKVL